MLKMSHSLMNKFPLSLNPPPGGRGGEGRVRGIFAFALMVFFGTSTGVFAHESQPGMVELRQVAQDRYEVTWRAPIYYGQPHPARLELPSHWKTVVDPTMGMLSDSQVFRSVVVVGSTGVEGSILRFPGLENTITDVFVRLNRLDGTVMTAVVRPTKPYAQLRGERTWYTTAGEYIGLGFHHILQGVDHLLFVLGLMLIVKGRMALLKTITAFTIAHSITLAIATLGYANAPLPPSTRPSRSASSFLDLRSSAPGGASRA